MHHPQLIISVSVLHLCIHVESEGPYNVTAMHSIPPAVLVLVRLPAPSTLHTVALGICQLFQGKLMPYKHKIHAPV